MNVQDALKGSALDAADAEVLLSRAVGRDRTWLSAHPEETLTDEQWTTFAQWVERRRTLEPVAYITGEQEFYGRPFSVDKRVLIPRPSTEGLVRAALRLMNASEELHEEVDTGIVVASRKLPRWHLPEVIVDVGTGSGCIAVTLALELPHIKVIATDVSEEALDVARINAARHGVESRIDFRQGRGLVPVAGLFESFMAVTNPPYIPHGRILMKDVVDHEPHVALFGGTQGTDVIESVVYTARVHPGCVAVVIECEEAQANIFDVFQEHPMMGLQEEI